MPALASFCRSALHTAADLLFPKTCAACQSPLHGPLDLCPDCATRLARIVGRDYCSCCGQDVGPYLLQGSRCTTCQNKRPWYDALRRVGCYTEPLSDMVIQFKYGRRPTLDALLGDWMADASHALLGAKDVDMWVPVPSPRLRTWRRRYQPTRLLADRIALRTTRPRRSVLTLARRMQEQKFLPPDERIANVRDAFRVGDHVAIEGRTVGLVDDVMTTGATLREAARTLRAAGAQRVLAVVLAVAQPGEVAGHA